MHTAIQKDPDCKSWWNCLSCYFNLPKTGNQNGGHSQRCWLKCSEFT